MAIKQSYTSVGDNYKLQNTADTTHLNPKVEFPDELPSRTLTDKEVAKTRWLPWLVLAFALNTFFFFSMTYALVDIEKFGVQNVQFFFGAWSIFLVPSLIAIWATMARYPSGLRSFRHRWSDKQPSHNYLPAVNFINAMFCLLFVILYLYVKAVPQYRNAIWTTELHYQTYLPIPAFAIIFWSEDANPITITQAQRDSGNFPTCTLINNTNNGDVFDCSHLMQMTTIGPHTAQLFNPEHLPIDRSSFTDLLSTVKIFSYVNYDSRKSDINATPPSQFSMAATFFDPRMNHTTVADCGLIGMATLPSFSTVTADIELTNTHDRYDLLDDSVWSVACGNVRDHLLSDEHKPYQSWSYALNAMRLSKLDTCDVATHGPDAYCQTSIAISYSTQMAATISSGPGISAMDIWINAGSILGGVQFFFWFLTLFSAY